MSRELRISAVVIVPDDAFEQATLLSKLNPAKEQFATALTKAVGSPVVVEARIVNPTVRTKKPTVVAQNHEHVPPPLPQEQVNEIMAAEPHPGVVVAEFNPEDDGVPVEGDDLPF